MDRLSVQIITLAPTVYTHCQHCELTFGEVGLGERLRRQEAAESLPEELARSYQALSDWVHRLLERHGDRVRVRVVDAVSIEGFLVSLRHRVGRYPAVIVDGVARRTGSDFASLDALIERRVAGSPSLGARD